MAEVRLEQVEKRFGDVDRRQPASTSISHDGEFVVLLGPTGAGKTTTLRLVAGLEKPDHGRISIGGRDATPLSPAARNVAFVFQQYSLYPHLSVSTTWPSRCARRRAAWTRRRSGTASSASPSCCASSRSCNNRATRLSGGEMQRVAIGRALVRSPSIYLMDEPLSSLDAKLRGELRLELKHIQQDLGATVLYVTHDQIEAMTMANRIGVMDHGRLVQIGSPREIYESPRNIYVATAARHAADQPAAAVGVSGPSARRRAPGPSARGRSMWGLPGPTAARMLRSSGSSIWATRITCISRSASTSW